MSRSRRITRDIRLRDIRCHRSEFRTHWTDARGSVSVRLRIDEDLVNVTLSLAIVMRGERTTAVFTRREKLTCRLSVGIRSNAVSNLAGC